MNNEEWESIIDELDRYLEENILIEPLRFNAVHANENEQIRPHRNVLPPVRMIGEILENMKKELDLDPHDICETALIEEDKWNELITRGCIRPEQQFHVIAIGFALIQKDKDKILSPEERMNILLYAVCGIECNYFILTIKFCLKKEFYDINKVNELLKKKGFPLLPDGTKN